MTAAELIAALELQRIRVDGRYAKADEISAVLTAAIQAIRDYEAEKR